MLSLHGRPLFPSEGPRSRMKPLPWWECVLTIATLSFICWLAISLLIGMVAA